MTPRSPWYFRAAWMAALVGTLGLLSSAPVQAKPMSSTDSMLRFFPDKPLGVFRAASLRLIIEDIETLVKRTGFGGQMGMGKAMAFQQMQKFLKLQKPIANFADAFQALGLGADPAIAVYLNDIPAKPYVAGAVVVDVTDATQLNKLITQFVPVERDRSRYRRCKRQQRMMQSRVDLQITSKPKQQPRLPTPIRMKAMCPGISLKLVNNKVVSEDLDGGFAAYRKVHGTKVQVEPLGKLGAAYKLDKLEYAIIANRYFVWGSSRKMLKRAVKRFVKSPAKPVLAAGFRKHLSDQARFQAYMDYDRYLQISMRLQEMMSQLSTGRRNPFMNSPQYKRLQKFAMSMGKGYDAMWFDGRASQDRYSMYSSFTTKKVKSPLVALMSMMVPAPIRSLAMLPHNTIAVFSMNIVQLYFKLAGMFLKKSGNKALGMFSVDQWKGMFGDEITIAVSSSATSPVQVMLLVEVKQAQALAAMLGSLQAMLGAGGKSPLKTETFQGVNLTYLFKGKGKRKRKRGRRSPADRMPPGEIAWGFTGNFFVLSYQMTRKPNLAVLKRMIDPKARRTTSILTQPTMMRLLNRTKQTNMLMYVAIPKLMQAITPFIPPIPQAQQALRALAAFSHIFMHARNEVKTGTITTEGELQLNPPAPRKLPKK